MILPPVGLVFIKLGNLNSYKFLNSQVSFAYLLALLKSWSIPQLWFVKTQLLGVLKLINAHMLPPGR